MSSPTTVEKTTANPPPAPAPSLAATVEAIQTTRLVDDRASAPRYIPRGERPAEK